MRTKFSSFFTQLSDSGQREYLETTAVSQHRAVETVKTVQSACFLDHVQSRTQIEVIGITQNNLRLNILFQFGQMYSLNRAQCAHRHKDRCLYLPVVCGNQTRTGITFSVCIL